METVALLYMLAGGVVMLAGLCAVPVALWRNARKRRAKGVRGFEVGRGK